MSEQELNITPTRPYLARAIYEWVCDNQLTPYLLVDATQPHTSVPEQFIQDGQITLNLAPHAVHALLISNEAISFSARFGGVSRDLYIPMYAVIGLYARENGQGLFFDPSEYEHINTDQNALKSSNEEQTEQPKKKPSLRLLD
ncbi:ClpXP protease specificity-enhancing factor [Acinetobacter cumulans]|jgi:stringent starvation protein B|uniref:ClpXP protease specificity-enhancing factor n=1 Tax=Acinetobacter cumulans TaxID=2136182 RepID=A0A498CT57_9GAMM|nr:MULTISPECIES: ClpXP protease specificity-enhancing factor [Acinetobacter]NWK76067.1 ClpXP protease specificity-enhancing factor [Acinetobacter sp. SwsAc6]QCO20176.1 ClpXP protease specificity-enhancing factor [Acinetobacter cumulans]RFS35928.1 ClpXP protease specificity-enhancing factor [Acinetobacter sp. SWAC5]RKG48686.1 ClpXP protease specificity-enhancing factor [Acinetobacter cumulans]RLL31385.1 ClpXP protease specificity-enhancing factor [Acinetobacter cumulans]